MLAHRGLQHFRRQIQKVRADIAHQHDGPFDEAGDLGQKVPVFNNLRASGKGQLGSVMVDLVGARGRVQQHMRCLELLRVIVK